MQNGRKGAEQRGLKGTGGPIFSKSIVRDISFNDGPLERSLLGMGESAIKGRNDTKTHVDLRAVGKEDLDLN